MDAIVGVMDTNEFNSRYYNASIYNNANVAKRVPLLELASPILVLNLSTKGIPIGTLPFLKQLRTRY